MTMPTYETEQLILRPFTTDDVRPFLRMISEPEVVKYTGGGVSTNLSDEETIELMNKAPIGDYEAYGYGRHAIVYKENNEVIGFTGLKYLDELKETDLGYRMFPEYWGKGLATESCWPMLEYAFDDLKLPALIGIAMPENHASCHVLEKVGMTFIEDQLYEEILVKYYRLTREEYLTSK